MFRPLPLSFPGRIALVLLAGLACGRPARANFVLPDTSNLPAMYVSYNVPGASGTHVFTNGGNFYGTLDGNALAASYCVDLTRDISPPGTYTTTVTSNGTIFGTAVANAGGVAWLLVNLGPSATSFDQQNALQAAIWRTEYGTGFQLDGADNGRSGNSSTLIADYKADLKALGSNTLPVSDVLWISPVDVHGVHSQGLAGIYDQPVPEPSSLLLGVLGAAGAVGCLRRRNPPPRPLGAD